MGFNGIQWAEGACMCNIITVNCTVHDCTCPYINILYRSSAGDNKQLGVALDSASQNIDGPPTATLGRQQEGVCRHPEIQNVFVDVTLIRKASARKAGPKKICLSPSFTNDIAHSPAAGRLTILPNAVLKYLEMVRSGLQYVFSSSRSQATATVCHNHAKDRCESSVSLRRIYPLRSYGNP